MVQGNFAKGDYWIDCGYASLYILRAGFGAWVAVCVTIIATCLRAAYRSHVRRRLLTEEKGSGGVSIWHISPASTPTEALEIRNLLGRSLLRGEFFFPLVSLVCVGAAIVTACSTTIANYAIQQNTASRFANINGNLATNSYDNSFGGIVDINARIAALRKANAPLEELFDYAPDDASNWVYVAEEWNNTWQGRCTYDFHPAVDLVVMSTNSSNFQDEVPALGSWLPQWVGVERQGIAYSGTFDGAGIRNDSGYWRDILVTYAFGGIDFRDQEITSVNVSFANFLARNVGRNITDPTQRFVQTAFRSDVHVVDCTFNKTAPGNVDRARAEGMQYGNYAINIDSVYTTAIAKASFNGLPVVQPTAQDMLRYWQAYMSVKDTQSFRPVPRRLSVSTPVVQIRLSALIATIGGLALAIAVESISYLSERRIRSGRQLRVPSSRLDWIVQAVREHTGGAHYFMRDPSSTTFAAEREDVMLSVSQEPNGDLTTRIVSTAFELHSLASSV